MTVTAARYEPKPDPAHPPQAGAAGTPPTDG